MSVMHRRSLVFISILSIASARLSAGDGYGDILKEFQGDIFKVARQHAVGLHGE
jgi:hypothetical protein